MAYVVAVEGISALRDLETIPNDVKLAAARAVNYATRKSRTRAAELMREQVNFPARYLVNSENGRLRQGRAATTEHLESSITGRFSPTSLARFVKGNPAPGKPGVRVEVAPGFAKRMRRAFIIRLPQGKTLTDDTFNRGLAIRLKPGETLSNKIRQVQLKDGLTLLFGPSVDQVFRTVAADMLPEVEGLLQDEFLRLMSRRGEF